MADIFHRVLLTFKQNSVILYSSFENYNCYLNAQGR